MKEINGIKVLKKCKKAEMLLDLYNKSTVKSIFEIYPVKEEVRNLCRVKINEWAEHANDSLEEFVRKPFNVTDSRILMHENGSFVEGSIAEFGNEKYLIVFGIGLRLMSGEECAIKL